MQARLQFSLTSSLLGLAVGPILIGPYSDVLGRRVPLIASLIILSLS